MKTRHQHLFRLFFEQSVPIIIGILLLGLGAAVISHHFLRRTITQRAEESLRMAGTYYDTVLDEMDALSLEFGVNTEIFLRLQAIATEQKTSYDAYRDSRVLAAFIGSAVDSHPYIDSIMIALSDPDAPVLTSGSGFQPRSYCSADAWITDFFLRSHPDGNYSEPIISKRQEGTEKLIRISRPIQNSQGNEKGVIILDLKEKALKNAPSFSSGYLSVTNKKGELLFQNFPENEEYRDDQMQYFTAQSKKYGWRYTLSFAKIELYALTYTIVLYTIVLTVLALILTLGMAERARAKERQFIENIMHRLHQSPDDDSIDSYKNVYDYLNYHILKVFIEEDYLRWQKEAMEYRALQMQINPHFLFNTLDTIYWKTIKLSGSENDVSNMTQLLSKLLQYSLRSDGLSGVRLGKELEQTRYYVRLQSFRFPSTFTYIEHIDASLLGATVPCLFLEPLLENSLSHGMKEKEALHITLSIQKKGDDIILVLENDGKNIDEDALAKLNDSSIDVLKQKKSLGIANTRKRLMLFFQGKASMNIENRSEGGVRICIVFPLRQEEEEDVAKA